MNSQFSRMRNRSRLRLVGAVPPGTSTRTSAERQGGANPFDLSNEPIVRGPAPHPDLAERVRQIGHIDAEYAEEFILQTLGQLLRAGVPLDAIAQKIRRNRAHHLELEEALARAPARGGPGRSTRRSCSGRP